MGKPIASLRPNANDEAKVKDEGVGEGGERNVRRADVLEESKVGVSIQKVGLAQGRKQSLCPEEQEEQQLLRWLTDVEEVLECNTEMVSTNGLIACEESSQRGWEGDEVRRLVGGGRKERKSVGQGGSMEEAGGCCGTGFTGGQR